MSPAPHFEYQEIRGAGIEPHLDELGRLRIAVFREFPYLYDGDLDYERDYLQVYLRSPRSLVVLLRADGRTVGATTCLPMVDEGPEFQEPFRQADMDVNSVFYLGESVVLPEFRGHGAGREFMKRRESHAQELGGFRFTTFCAVDRPADHPARPADYRPLDQFWTRMGYSRRPDLTCQFPWKEIGQEGETPKQLTFWLKEWT